MTTGASSVNRVVSITMRCGSGSNRLPYRNSSNKQEAQHHSSVNRIEIVIMVLTTVLVVVLQFRQQSNYNLLLPNEATITTAKVNQSTIKTKPEGASVALATASGNTNNAIDTTGATWSKITTLSPPISTTITTITAYSPVTTAAPAAAPAIIVVQYQHWMDLERFVGGIWGTNLFCNTIDDLIQQYYKNNTDPTATGKKNIPIPTIHMSFELSCQELFHQSKEGTGNYIQLIYMMRLSLQYITNAKIRLNITCTDVTNKEVQSSYILPWFTGVWYSPHYYRNIHGNRQINYVLRLFTGVWYSPHYKKNNQGNGDDNGKSLQLRATIESNSSSTIIPIRLQGQPQRPTPQLKLQHKVYCGPFYFQPTALMVNAMRYDIRRMVIALSVGGMNNPYLLQSDAVTSEQSVDDDPTEFPHRTKILNFIREEIYLNETMTEDNAEESSLRKVQHLSPGNQQERIDAKTTVVLPLLDTPLSVKDLDDVIVHFRCGDLLSTNLPSYGFLTFHGYCQHINITTTKTIGIVTQPFGPADPSTNSNAAIQQRTLDSGNTVVMQRCRTLVYAFVDYLHEIFPSTTITIRNNVSDSIAVTYVRMVLAKQVIGSMSTFSVFPIVGTFGKGYYLSPKNLEPSMWMIHPQYHISKALEVLNDSGDNNIILFHDNNTLVGPQTRMLWDQYGEEAVLKWFRTGERDTNIQGIIQQMNNFKL